MPVDRPPLAGLRHVALNVLNYEATRSFYVEVLGFQIEWEPDNDNVYLTSGHDNLALHRVDTDMSLTGQQLDHIGVIAREPEHVDAWHQYLDAADVEILVAPKTHRDGARSFYCLDPNGTKVQFIYHPPIANSI